MSLAGRKCIVVVQGSGSGKQQHPNRISTGPTESRGQIDTSSDVLHESIKTPFGEISAICSPNVVQDTAWPLHRLLDAPGSGFNSADMSRSWMSDLSLCTSHHHDRQQVRARVAASRTNNDSDISPKLLHIG